MAYMVDEHGRIIDENGQRRENPYSNNDYASSSNIAFARVFGYMFVGFLISALSAFLFGYLFATGIANGTFDGFGYDLVIIGTAILVLILNFVIQARVMKNSEKSLIPVLVIYCSAMGLFMSSFTIFIDWRILGAAFVLTTVLFGLLSVIAMTLKEKIKPFGVVAYGLLGGMLLLFPLYFILSLFISDSTMIFLGLGISMVMFIFILIITAYDIGRVKELTSNAALTKNMELYLAYVIYLDFINIFIKLVRFLAVIARKD